MKTNQFAYIPPPPPHNQTFQRCDPNDHRAIGIYIRSGDIERKANISMDGILRLLVAGYTPEKKVVRGRVALLPEHLDRLKIEGIAVEKADDNGNYQTVEPLWIDGYYAYRR